MLAARDFLMEERRNRSQGKGVAYKKLKSSSPVGDLAKDSRDEDRMCVVVKRRRGVCKMGRKVGVGRK